MTITRRTSTRFSFRAVIRLRAVTAVLTVSIGACPSMRRHFPDFFFELFFFESGEPMMDFQPAT